MKYFIIVNKNNGNSSKYESENEAIVLNKMSEDEAIKKLLEYGDDVNGYTRGTSGSPTHKYELTLWAEIGEDGSAEPIKSVYTNSYD